jgi:glycosyltransferase involved in cell wall biosynthesis
VSPLRAHRISPPMRVLLIADWMSHPGGSEVYIAWLREALRRSGDEVKLLTSFARPSNGGSPDFAVYGSDRAAAQALLQIYNPFSVVQVRRALRAFRPDVVLVSMFAYHLSPAILPQLRHVPTVLSVLDYKIICPTGSKLLPNGTRCTEPAGSICWRNGCVSLPHWARDQPRYTLIRSGLKHVRRVLSCSRWVQRELALNGVASEHLPLPVALPSPRFHRAPDPQPLFIYCGRLTVEKGLPLLLRAFAKLVKEVPTAHLRLVGEGTQRPILERMAEAIGLAGSITFTGGVPAAQVEDHLVDPWALVAPSLWAEPFGLVALEAIVRGIPVIASANGGLGETVENGVTGLLFPNGDEEALLQQLHAVASGRAFSSHALPESIVNRVRESYALDGHRDRLRGIFAELIGG